MVDRLVNSEANRRRIETVEGSFGTFGSKLAIPGRVLVGEGVLTKICRKKPKPRQFFLFSDLLVYGTILISKKKYNNQHIIPLEGVTLQDLEDLENLKNGWVIKTPNKSFAVYAATPTEKVEWMAHINKCIEDLIKRTGKQPTGSHAAVWIPDSNTKICMHCNKTQFTMINRRHHCRNCGKVTCNSCSKNKFLIPSQSSKPLRVCDSCFSTLCRGRTSSDTFDTPVVASNGNSSPAAPPKVEQVAAGASKPPQDDVKSCPSDEKKTDAETSDDSGDSDVDADDLDVDASNLELEDNKPTFYSTSFSIEDEVKEEIATSPAQPISPQTEVTVLRSAPLPPSPKLPGEKEIQLPKESNGNSEDSIPKTAAN